MEIILDELTYDGYLLSKFLQVRDKPLLKLTVVCKILLSVVLE